MRHLPIFAAAALMFLVAGFAPAIVQDEPIALEPQGLLRIELPHEKLGGLNFGFDGWTPATKIDPYYLELGFEGVHLVGRPELTHVYPAKDADTTVYVSHRAGTLRFENLVFHCGSRMAIHIGVESAASAEPRPMRVEFINCGIVSDLEKPAKWGVMSYQASLLFEDCWFEGKWYEHPTYQHGIAYPGTTFDGCRFDVECAEIIKLATRPLDTYYPEGTTPGKHAKIDGLHPARGPNGERATLHVLDCYLTGWSAPHAFHGGGGGAALVGQGPDVHIVVERSVFVNDDGGHAVGIESMSEYFGPDGIATHRPGTGTVALIDSLFLADSDDGKWQPLVRVHDGAALFVSGCGIYGERARFAVELMEGRTAIVAGCNTPEIRARAEEWLEFAELDVALDDAIFDQGAGKVSDGLLRLGVGR